jgi:DNA-binding CsgD family transcriptional regulator
MKKDNTTEAFYIFFIDSLQSNEKIELKEKEYYLNKNLHLNCELHSLPCALYLLDFHSQSYLYISKEIINLSGYTYEEYIQLGHDWFLSLLLPEDAKQYQENIFKDFVHFSSKLNKEQINNTCFSIYYRIKHKNGSCIQLLDQFIVLETDESRNPILVMGTYNDVTCSITEPKNIFSISEINPQKGNKLLFHKVYLEAQCLTSKEKEIVSFLKEGATSKKIAILLNISIHTVNAHRRNILEKLKFKNTAELICYCMTNDIT